MQDGTEGRGPPARARVLAVDDSPTCLAALAATLRAEGCDVALARSGEEALASLAARPADCVVLDVVMPGVDGMEACRRIKADPALRDTAVVLLTSRDDRAALLEGLRSGADDFLSKASDPAVVGARVQSQLRRKRVEDEHRRVRERLLRTEMRAAEERAARVAAEERAALVGELERANRELESFSYAVSHDLRAPLRVVDGFARVLQEDYGPALDAQGRWYLERLRAAAQRMASLIDDLLALSRLARSPMRRERCDLSAMARRALAELREREPARDVEVVVADGLAADADPRLAAVALDNLLGNAWKYTSKRAHAVIEVGAARREGAEVFFVRDNGAGFPAGRAKELFAPFQRLHPATEFEGTGVGLATVMRVVSRHGGRAWAEGEEGRGATFYFTFDDGAASAEEAPPRSEPHCANV
ncbi:MAG: response regulator [Polyangiales bacterium]